MWKRTELKEKAREVLHQTYWASFGVTTLAAVLTVSVSTVIRFNNLFKQLTGSDFFHTILVWWLCAFLILFSIFVGNVVQVGMKYFFIRNRDGETRTSHLFYGFRHNYWNIVGVQFMTNFIVSLASLLLIVPGIIVGYQYCMVPYLLSENPQMNGTEARALSTKMTDDQKLYLFALDLSFIGWIFLGNLCFIVGGLFVTPYMQATKAELYITLRDRLNPALPTELKKEENEYASVEHRPVEPE